MMGTINTNQLIISRSVKQSINLIISFSCHFFGFFQGYGAALVSVNTLEENNFITQRLKNIDFIR